MMAGTRHSSKFFKPTEKFLHWFKGYVGNTPVTDAGCGTGHFAKALNEIGVIKILGLEIWPCSNPEYDTIIGQDATTFAYSPGSIVTIVRPNRGEWIHKTIEQALYTAEQVVYIGLPKHWEDDIRPLIGEYDMWDIVDKYLHEPVGEDGEYAYIIKKKSGNPKEPIMQPVIVEEPEETYLPPVRGMMRKKDAPPKYIRKPASKKGKPCTKCGGEKYYDDDNPDGMWCYNCGLVNVTGLNYNEKFDFSEYENDDDDGYYLIGGRKIQIQTLLNYLRFRRGSGAERVLYHKLVLLEAGFGERHGDSDYDVEIRRNNNWVDYFEKWIEAYMGDPLGDIAWEKANLDYCSKCNKEIKFGDARMNYPSGVVCMECG